jgi:hypothetical protein
MSTTSATNPAPNSLSIVDARRMGIVIHGNLPFEIQGSFVRSTANGGRIVSRTEQYSLLSIPFHLRGERLEQIERRNVARSPLRRAAEITPNHGLLSLIRDHCNDSGIEHLSITPEWIDNHFERRRELIPSQGIVSVSMKWRPSKFENLLNRGPILDFIARANTGEIILCGDLRLENVLQEIICQTPGIRIAIVTSTTEQAREVSSGLTGARFVARAHRGRLDTEARVIVAAVNTFDSNYLQEFLRDVDLYLVVSPECMSTVALSSALGGGTFVGRVFLLRSQEFKVAPRLYDHIVRIVGIRSIFVNEHQIVRRSVGVTFRTIKWRVARPYLRDCRGLKLFKHLEEAEERNRRIAEVVDRVPWKSSVTVVVCARNRHAAALASKIKGSKHIREEMLESSNPLQDFGTGKVIVCSTETLGRIPSIPWPVTLIWAGARSKPFRLPEHLCWAGGSNAPIRVIDLRDRDLGPTDASARSDGEQTLRDTLRKWNFSRLRVYQKLEWGATEEAFRSKTVRAKLFKTIRN